MKKILLRALLFASIGAGLFFAFVLTQAFAKDKPIDIANSTIIVSSDGTMIITSVKKEDIVIIDGKFVEKPQDTSISYETVNLTASGNFTIGKEEIPLYIKE